MKSQIRLLFQPAGWPLSKIPIEIMTFPGGELHVKIPEPHHEIIQADDLYIDARVSDAEGLVALSVLADAVRHHNRHVRLHLFIPYLPAARQDRPNPLTARVYADILNAVGFSTVVGVDPHSDVMPALINNFVKIPAEDVFPRDLFPGPEEAVMLCPDQGATKRTEAVANKYGYQVIYARKHRDPVTGKLSKFSADTVPAPVGKLMHVIVVDDICDGGGTFLGVADVLSDEYSRKPLMHLWTTHGIYSSGVGILASKFVTIASTDSFPQDYRTEGLTRFSLKGTLQTLVNQGVFE